MNFHRNMAKGNLKSNSRINREPCQIYMEMMMNMMMIATSFLINKLNPKIETKVKIKRTRKHVTPNPEFLVNKPSNVQISVTSPKTKAFEIPSLQIQDAGKLTA